VPIVIGSKFETFWSHPADVQQDADARLREPGMKS